MRLALLAATIGLGLIGISSAAQAQAQIRKSTNIPQQTLGTALRALAKDHNFQVLFKSELVRDLRTAGAVGELTTNEALARLLSGTSLTFQYLDEKTVTIIPIQSSSASLPVEMQPPDRPAVTETLRIARAEADAVATAQDERKAKAEDAATSEMVVKGVKDTGVVNQGVIPRQPHQALRYDIIDRSVHCSIRR